MKNEWKGHVNWMLTHHSIALLIQWKWELYLHRHTSLSYSLPLISLKMQMSRRDIFRLGNCENYVGPSTVKIIILEFF